VSLDLERLCYPFFDFVIDVERDGPLFGFG